MRVIFGLAALALVLAQPALAGEDQEPAADVFPLRLLRSLPQSEQALLPFQHPTLLQAPCRHGEVQVAGTTLVVSLLDLNRNGRFDEFNARQMTQGDLMLMREKNQAPAADPDPLASLRRQFAVLRQTWRDADGNYYSLTPSADGSELSVGRDPLPTGNVRVDTRADGGLLVLSGPRGVVMLEIGLETAAAPVGDYQPLLALLTAEEDDKGQLVSWAAIGRFGPGAPTLTVSAEETAEFSCGPPLAKTVSLQQQGNNFSLSLQITGSAGEAYSTFLRDGRQPPAPGFNLMTEGGQSLASGVFRYG